MTDQPTRRFVLERAADASGVSGTGTVADGAQFPDGTTVLRWRGPHPSTVVWPDIDTAMHVHGHGGATVTVWLDANDAPDLLTTSALDADDEAHFTLRRVARHLNGR